MNKNLIQKLLIQSCWDEQDEIELEDWINVERFALSIVQECCNIVRDEVQYINDFDTADAVITEVKKHFGIEE